MQKISLLIAVAALALCANTQSSEAAAAWKCKKRHCFWTEGYTGSVPDYAAAWAAPQAPGCYYVQGRFSKRWAHYCPPSNPPMQ